MNSARRVMVDNQIRTFDVTNALVLAAFDSVPREHFVPEADRALAYTDKAVVVSGTDGGRALLTPLVLARFIQALAPQAGEKALDVLGGWGYSAAVFAAAGLETCALESDAGLVATAGERLAAAGVSVQVLPAQPALSAERVSLPGRMFDVILINGASEIEPAGFFPLLLEGGRLGVIRRNAAGQSQATIYLKANGVVSGRRAFDAQGAVLPGFAKAPSFVF